MLSMDTLMDAILENSDTLLRPEVGIVLPMMAASQHNYALLLMATALQPLKWASGCGCFTQLCARKRWSVRMAVALMAAGLAFHFADVAPGNAYAFLFAAVMALCTGESVDTKVVKALAMAAGYLLDGVSGALCWAVLAAAYGLVTGWSVGQGEVLLRNRVWIMTKRALLAKRINRYGEFHLEYQDKNGVVLIGDGRLIRKGVNMREDLRMEGLVDSPGNLETLWAAEREGRVVVKDGHFALVA